MIGAAFILNPGAFADTYGEECLRAIAPAARLLGSPITSEQLAASPPPWLGEVEVLFTGWGSPCLDAALLERMPRLRAVFYGAGTLRFLVTDACWERGLVIANAAALNAVPTAEFAAAAIVLSLKRAWPQARLVRALRHFPAPSMRVPGGVGAVVGLVSLGHVGRRVAEKLREIEVEVLAHDPLASPELLASLGVQAASLDEVFSRADVVSLHTPLLPETAGMIDARLFAQLKDGATFINTARGALVNEDDMIAMLQARPDVQAIIDVTDPEPPDENSRLYDLPNVFLTPHIAGSIGAECRRMGRAMIEEFHRFAVGKPLHHAVSREWLAHNA